MNILIAVSSNVMLAWALSAGLRPWVVAFAGFVCGFSWALSYARYAIERAGI